MPDNAPRFESLVCPVGPVIDRSTPPEVDPTTMAFTEAQRIYLNKEVRYVTGAATGVPTSKCTYVHGVCIDQVWGDETTRVALFLADGAMRPPSEVTLVGESVPLTYHTREAPVPGSTIRVDIEGVPWGGVTRDPIVITQERPQQPAYEIVDQPAHYNVLPCGVEVIEIIQGLPFNIGTACKHALRAGRKPGMATVVDLQKAVQYLTFEINRITTGKARP